MVFCHEWKTRSQCVPHWRAISVTFCVQFNYVFPSRHPVIQPRWGCATWNTKFFSNLSLRFHFTSRGCNFNCVNRHWFMFASYCDIWLLCLCFVGRGESPGCRLLGTTSMLGVVEKPPFYWFNVMGPKNHFDLASFRCINFVYIPVSLLWKWRDAVYCPQIFWWLWV